MPSDTVAKNITETPLGPALLGIYQGNPAFLEECDVLLSLAKKCVIYFLSHEYH